MAPLAHFTADELIDSIEFLLSIRSKLKRMEIDAGGPEALLRAVRSGTGVGCGGSGTERTDGGTGWRCQLSGHGTAAADPGRSTTMSAWHGEHALLAGTSDRDAAAASIVRLACPHLFQQGRQLRQKTAIIAKKRTTAGTGAEYEKAFLRNSGMLGRSADLAGSISAGREAVSLLRLFQTADRELPDFEAQGRAAGLRRSRDLRLRPAPGARVPGHPLLARPEDPPFPRGRIPGHERHPVGHPEQADRGDLRRPGRG